MELDREGLVAKAKPETAQGKEHPAKAKAEQIKRAETGKLWKKTSTEQLNGLAELRAMASLRLGQARNYSLINDQYLTVQTEEGCS